MDDCVGDGGRSGESDIGEGASSSSPSRLGDWFDDTDDTRVAFDEERPLAVDLIDPASDLSAAAPSSPESALADARGLSIDLSRSDFEPPGILERIDPLNDRDEPCVSDLLNDGRPEIESGALKFVAELFLGVREPSLPLDCCWPIAANRRSTRPRMCLYCVFSFRLLP